MKNLVSAYQDILVWVSVFSFFFFVASLAAVPWLIARLDRDYFLTLFNEKRSHPMGRGQQVKILLKNILGALIFVMGGVMLFLPGQGLLTMVAGLMIMEFPGKRAVLKFFVKKKKIQRGLNWFRQKKNAPLLRFPPES